MSNVKNTMANRVLSVILSVVMVLSTIPFSAISAFAGDLPEIEGITVVANDLTYDGNAQELVTVSGTQEGDTVLYSTTGVDGNWVSDAPTGTDAKDYSVFVEVLREGYEPWVSDQIPVVIKKATTMTGVSVQSAGDLKYNGRAQDLTVTVNGAPNGSKYQYGSSSVGPWSNDFLKETELKTEGYPVYVKVLNPNYEEYVVNTPAMVKINKGDLDIKVTKNDLTFNGNDQVLVTVEGQQNSDKVEYSYDNATWEEWKNDAKAPKGKNAGDYSVYIHVTRNDNYEVFESGKIDVTIARANDMGVEVKANNDLTYDGNAHELVTVSGTQEGDTVSYSTTGEDGTWVSDVPTGTDAKNYTVFVKVERDGFNTFESEAIEVTIKKAPQTIQFDEAPKQIDYDVDKVDEDKNENIYTFKASATGSDTTQIKYSVSGENATINATTGELTVTGTGTIIITATKPDDNNYDVALVSKEYTVKATGDLLKAFVNVPEENYVFGTNNGVISEATIKAKDSRDDGVITYAIVKGELSSTVDESCGVKIDETSGKLSISDYKALANALHNAENKPLTVTVKATKAESKNKHYGEDSKTYTVTIEFAEMPTNDPLYLLSGDQAENATDKSWYVGDITVEPSDAENYTIYNSTFKDGAYSFDEDGFGPDFSITDDGAVEKYVFLKNINDGGITDMVTISAKELQKDAKAPKAELSYDVKTLKNTVDKYLFHNPTVTMTFTATDKNGDAIVSGLDCVKWTYNAENGDETKTEEGTLNFVSAPDEEGNTSVSLTLPGKAEQYRGRISFTVFDKAGNSTTYEPEKDHIIVVDTISPEMEVAYNAVAKETDNGTILYFDKDHNATATFTVNEANFDSADVKVFVNGNETPTVSWEDKSADEHVGTLMLPDDGHYTIEVTYTDKSGNEMKPYTSPKLVVDKTAPKIQVGYSKESFDFKDAQTMYYNGDITAKFTVTETNFFAEDVVVTVTKDGKTIATPTVSWSDVENTDEHIGTMVLSADGDYTVTVNYTDRSNNEMDAYKSTNTYKKLVVDTVKPVVTVAYQNDGVASVSEKDGRQYYPDTKNLVVTVKEHNFSAARVAPTVISLDASLNKDSGKITTATDYTKYLQNRNNWKEIATDTYQAVLTFNTEANYTFEVACTDFATNAADKPAAKVFTVDKTAPAIQSVEYSKNLRDALLSGITCGFYNDKVTVTVTAVDAVSGVDEFLYSYILASGVSQVNAELREQIVNSNITYSADKKTASITFTIPKSALTSTNQFNGTVETSATDRSGNNSKLEKDTKRLVVDNIAPTATVTFNTPTATSGGVAYYNGDIKGTITITEANFDANDVKVNITKNGAIQAVAVNWTNVSVDKHVGTFTLSADADYVVGIEYTDKSNNSMTPYKSGQMTVDTDIKAPTFTINGTPKSGNGGAYNGDVNVGFNFSDQNFRDKKVTLTRTTFDKTEDVTESFVKISMNGKGGVGSFDIPKTVENDGIYVLKVAMTDKANHSTDAELKFTINRFGSVYEYSQALCDLIANGGQYVQSVGKDLVITEYNASPRAAGSLKVLITKDGETIDVDMTESGVQAENGWYLYTYTIKKANFANDGVYKIAISSTDVNGNTSTSVPENSIAADGTAIKDVMTFTVDSTKPEILNIVNLEKAIADKANIKDGKLNVQYSLVDVGGLAKVEVYVNGTLVDTVSKFENANSYNGSFDITESKEVQKVRLVITDLAGNVTDTDENFDPGDLFVFNDEVTVSTDFFVRFYRNAALFWGSIGGVVVLAGGLILLIAKKKKKSDEDK